MRIVIWGINYPPELTGIAPCNSALCEFLAEMGNDVTMLTAFPYYPTWRKQARDAGKLFAYETCNGVQVIRCWHYVPSRPNALERILHELSFVTTSFLKLLFAPRPDLLMVVSPPLLLGVAARAFCWLRGGRYLMHIQDLQPDAAIRLGMVRSKALIDFFRRAEYTAYRGAWRASAISHGMLEALRVRGVPEDKLLYFPNGVQLPGPASVGRFREVNRFGADKFLVVYSGNLGVKQGLQKLIDASKILRNRSIELIICGEGAEKKRLLAAAVGLPNVWFKGLLDDQSYQEMLADADLMVIPLVAGSGNSFFPHKLLSSCAAGKPVLAVCDLDSELAQTVRTNRCGEVVPPEDAHHLARTLDALSQDRARLKSMGIAAREFAEQFNQWKVLKQFWEQVERPDGRPASAELAVSDR
jgi:putative colanic acid biosynthesis glycosyltransferase WcaI